MLNLLAVYFNEEVADQVREVVSHIDGIDLTLRNVSEARPLNRADLDPIPDLVLFEINGHNVQDMADIEQLLQTQQDKVTVFVTYKHGDMATMRRLMRAGVSDVFEQPIRAQELTLAITEVMSKKRSRQQAARGGKGGVTVFIDAKSGSGATTLSVNVAHMLVVKHKAKVALVDLDLQFGSVALALDLEPRDTAIKALANPHRVDEVFLNALMTRHDSGLDVLASPVSIVPSEEVSEEGAACILETASEGYEFVIVDLERGLSKWEQRVLKMADPVVLVIQNNLATIRDAKLLIDKLPSIGVPLDHVEVVVNRSEGKAEHISDAQLEKVLEGVTVHRVRNDYETAAKAFDEGMPLLDADKRSPLTKDIAALAEYLYSLHMGETGKKGGVFSHLFGRH